MDTIFEALTHYYGLDWVAMAMGLYGTFLLTRQNRLGFLLTSIACVCGLTVAVMSHQAGYIVYNFILMGMTAKAFWAHTSGLKLYART